METALHLLSWLFVDPIIMFSFFKRKRRMPTSQPSFSPEWQAILQRNVRYYNYLSTNDRKRLEGLIQIFLEEKKFEGAGGLTLTDEIRITIAGQACILILNRETEIYPGLRTIILYPSAFVATQRRYEGGIVHEGPQVRLGESWDRGILILSWRDSLRGGIADTDGSNLVFHEFAHQLDDEWVMGRGTPDLGKKELYQQWQRVMSREFMIHVSAVASGEPTVIDPYGATSPAEFFAVLTEAFFEQPHLILAYHPSIYQLLKEYYQQDPVKLIESSS